MAKSKTSIPSDYVVGYGRPPKETQFQPGKSGNPTGRRRGSRTVGAILADIIGQKIPVTENGKTRRMPALEVMLRRLVNDAMRGETNAMKLLISFVDRYADTAETKVQLGELLAEDRRILPNFFRSRRSLSRKTMGGRGMLTDARLFEALLRDDFRAFIGKVFTTLCPSQEFVWSWHIEAIAYRLEQIRRGEITRLIINMPPRSLKSIAASVAFPAFVLGLDPTSRIICVSYSSELAKKHSNDFRTVVNSPWYQRAFPATKIGPYKNSETEIEFTARGFRLATSVGGTLTGRGGDIIIIDDPLKPDDAYSEAKRNSANEWFKNTLLSRLDDKRTGAIVIVMQRVHMDDLTGFVTDQSDEWEILNLPAIAEADEDIPISATSVYRRKAGEALSPVREPLSVLESLQHQIGSDGFYAQYQQMPVPPGGAMIKRNWIER